MANIIKTIPPFTLKIAGEYLPSGVKVLSRSLNITYDQAGTCAMANFTLIDLNQSGVLFYYKALVGKLIQIYEKGTLIFGGSLDEPTTTKLNAKPTCRYQIVCVDHHFICSRILINQSYPRMKISDLFKLICDTYLLEDGIWYDSNSIQDTISEVSINCPQSYVDTVFDELVDLIGWQWKIEPNKRLCLNDRTTDIGEVVNENSGYLFDSFNLSDDRGSYTNYCVLKDVNAITSEIIESASPVPDNNRSFYVRFKINQKPKIYISQSTTNPSEHELVDPRYVGINGLDTSMYWYWSKGSNTVTLDIEQELPPTGYYVVLKYYGQYEIDIIRENSAAIAERIAIEGGSGLYQSVENGDGIEGITIAEDKIQAIFDKNSRIAKKIMIATINRNFKSGQICDVVMPNFGINSLVSEGNGYLITDIKIEDKGVYLLKTITLTDGEAVDGWIKFFKKWMQKQTYHTIRENTTVEIEESAEETIDWNGTIIMTKYDCLYPLDDPGGLYPSNVLFPGTVDTTRILYD